MARSLYALDAEEHLTLLSPRSDGHDIVATGPWVRGACELAHRVVLRQQGKELIVHLQVIDVELGKAFYTHGNYYPNPVETGPGKPLTDAWTTFEDRVRRGLDIGPRPTPEPEEADDD